MCCCHQHHGPHNRGHHHGEGCGCGPHSRACDETGHRNVQECLQALDRLQTEVRAVEERIAALEES